jgi:hypothetical protein
LSTLKKQASSYPVENKTIRTDTLYATDKHDQHIPADQSHVRDESRRQAYAQIAREFGVSRSLVHIVLTRPLSPRPRRAGRRRTGGMRSLVVRLPLVDMFRNKRLQLDVSLENIQTIYSNFNLSLQH